MGMFLDFVVNGFSSPEQLRLYSPGTLYEVLSRLGDKSSGDAKRNKVKTLLHSWFTPCSAYRDNGQQVPAYALEIHAMNEPNNMRDGYGTYIFVPEGLENFVVNPLTSTFSEPQMLYDDEDPLKILSSVYADADGYSINKKLTIRELSLQSPEYLPLNLWNKELSIDPLEELFGVFDNLPPALFAGVQLVVIPPEDDWQQSGKMRIREIEDPDYATEVGLFETIRRMINDEPSPQEEAERLAGYRKRELDPFEKEERDAIQSKISGQGFRCSLRVYAATPEIADDICGLIIQRNSSRFNSFTVTNSNGNLIDLALRRETAKPFLLSVDEIASIWHVPDEETTGARCHRPLPAATRPPDSLLIIPNGGEGDIQYFLNNIAMAN